ncbi:MAG: ATP-dependent DNA helicase [Limisphaerales bacterium]
MKFDPANKVFEVSVRELAEEEAFPRIGFAQGEGWNRLGLGAELHSRVLAQRIATKPGYRSEVFLQAKIAVEDWTAHITGRLDGCIQLESGAWLIEEFKSGYLAVDDLRRSAAGSEKHRRQLLIYCHLWQLLGNKPVEGSLVYVDLVSDREHPISLTYDSVVEEKLIHRRLQALLAIWRQEAKQRQLKAAAAQSLPFPHQTPRPGQQRIIDAVRATMETGGHLMAEAPTGSGKTAAGIYPALAHGLTTGKQVVFLTSKTLQQKMAVSAFRAMNQSGAFRTVQLRAKEKMCANDRVLCHEDFCPYAKGYAEKMNKSRILDHLHEDNAHYDPDIVFAEAKRERVCPFEVQLELAARADAVVADYNYVFEPGTALRHLSRDDLDQAILLIDEAHNLPDRGRRIFSPELLEEQFRNVIEWLSTLRTHKKKRKRNQTEPDLWSLTPTDSTEIAEDLVAGLSESFKEACEMLEACAGSLPEKAPIAETQPPKDALKALWRNWEGRFVRYLSWKREQKLAMPDDPLVEAHFALQRFITVLGLFGPGFSCVVERRPMGIRLAIFCLDPARALGPVFQSVSASVLLSATLSPVEVVRRTLGLEKERTLAISLPPPFPKENRRIMILPQVQTTFAAREQNFGRIAQLIAQMADAQNGNVLTLFPSYTFLQKVHERLPATRSRVLMQRSDFSEKEREDIFKMLSQRNGTGNLLLAVLGGMYAEGVDYPGELLSGVFIVSPGLPQISFDRELLRRYFEESEQAGFEYAYLQPGMTRVVQAAGRLIRSETDRGVIALLCQRFVQEPYAAHMPRDWFNDSALELVVKDPVAEVKNFFRNSKTAPAL